VSASEFGRQLGERPGPDPLIDDMQAQIDDLADRLNNACADLVEERSQRAHLATELAGADETIRVLLADNEQTLTDGADGWARAERYRLAWMSARRRSRLLDQENNVLSDMVRDHEQLHAWRVDEGLKNLAERDEARAEVVRLGRENELLATALREANGNRAVMIAQHRALISVVRDREAAAMAEGAPGFAAATERLRAALAEERIEPLGGEGGDRT
jgi:hypothetical protein